MPKIIENIREQLLAEAKRQISEHGYSRTTVRSVAGACGVGVGTVYNYFPSKEMLVAGFMAEDWRAALVRLAELPKEEPRELLQGIYDTLQGFAENNKRLFCDADAAKAISVSFSERHKMLRGQIAEFVLPVCGDIENRNFASEFISEALICWSMEGREFDAVYGIVENLLKK